MTPATVRVSWTGPGEGERKEGVTSELDSNAPETYPVPTIWYPGYKLSFISTFSSLF